MVTHNYDVRSKIISHQQLRERLPRLKNFDAWIASLRRLKILPRSIRKGNIAGLKRGNIGVHPEPAAEFLKKLLNLRALQMSYDDIKKELEEEIKDMQFLYGAQNAFINEPRAKSDELFKTYSAVLGVLEEYYGWKKDSYNSRFYRKVVGEFEKTLHVYLAAKMLIDEIEEEGNTPKFHIVDEKDMADKTLDFYFDTIYFIIHQYGKLRKEGKVKDIKISK